MLDRMIRKARDFADMLGQPGRERRALREHMAIVRARALRYAFTSEAPEWTDHDEARWRAHAGDCPECRHRITPPAGEGGERG